MSGFEKFLLWIAGFGLLGKIVDRYNKADISSQNSGKDISVSLSNTSHSENTVTMKTDKEKNEITIPREEPEKNEA